MSYTRIELEGVSRWGAALVALANPRDTSISELLLRIGEVELAAPGDGLAAVLFGEYSLRRNPTDDAIASSSDYLVAALDRGEQVAASAHLLMQLANVRTTGGLDFSQRSRMNQALEAEPDWVSPWRVLAWYHESRSEWAHAVNAWERAIERLLPKGIDLEPATDAYESLFTGRLGPLQDLQWSLSAALEKL